MSFCIRYNAQVVFVLKSIFIRQSCYILWYLAPVLIIMSLLLRFTTCSRKLNSHSTMCIVHTNLKIYQGYTNICYGGWLNNFQCQQMLKKCSCLLTLFVSKLQNKIDCSDLLWCHWNIWLQKIPLHHIFVHIQKTWTMNFRWYCGTGHSYNFIYLMTKTANNTTDPHSSFLVISL